MPLAGQTASSGADISPPPIAVLKDTTGFNIPSEHQDWRKIKHANHFYLDALIP